MLNGNVTILLKLPFIAKRFCACMMWFSSNSNKCYICALIFSENAFTGQMGCVKKPPWSLFKDAVCLDRKLRVLEWIIPFHELFHWLMETRKYKILQVLHKSIMDTQLLTMKKIFSPSRFLNQYTKIPYTCWLDYQPFIWVQIDHNMSVNPIRYIM